MATLYAGAGLTEDSVPESEWQETDEMSDASISYE